MPISPREVLVGSIVSYQGTTDIVKSVAQYIMLEGHKEWIGGSLIDGEPITSKWLIKLGFEERGADDYFMQQDMMNWGMRVTKINDGTWVAFQGLGVQWSELRSVDYVHQLQGLFFYLMRGHLKILKHK